MTIGPSSVRRTAIPAMEVVPWARADHVHYFYIFLSVKSHRDKRLMGLSQIRLTARINSASHPKVQFGRRPAASPCPAPITAVHSQWDLTPWRQLAGSGQTQEEHWYRLILQFDFQINCVVWRGWTFTFGWPAVVDTGVGVSPDERSDCRGWFVMPKLKWNQCVHHDHDRRQGSLLSEHRHHILLSSFDIIPILCPSRWRTVMLDTALGSEWVAVWSYTGPLVVNRNRKEPWQSRLFHVQSNKAPSQRPSIATHVNCVDTGGKCWSTVNKRYT